MTKACETWLEKNPEFVVPSVSPTVSPTGSPVKWFGFSMEVSEATVTIVEVDDEEEEEEGGDDGDDGEFYLQ